jgi:hypothetical protein
MESLLLLRLAITASMLRSVIKVWVQVDAELIAKLK